MPKLQIYVLDVGQGDCILLRTLKGDVLIDAGTEASQETLCLRLKQLGVEEIALAIFTHLDEDHIGGADGVLTNFSVHEVWVNLGPSEEACVAALTAALEAQGIPGRSVAAGCSRNIGEVSFYVMSPFSEVSEGGNADSIVLKVTCGEISALFSGDADLSTEQALLSFYGRAHLDCDIYKVGHHGSNTSTGLEFLQSMTPDYAVISCGRGNSFGHPHGEVLLRLEQLGITVLRTDLEGEILLETDGKTIRQARTY
ncbi:MAG: MBL fold metallo-hydrolase [Clostridia bacterium]|nr:MBL fold metallo-hydrolase [Clostridia bacterium]